MIFVSVVSVAYVLTATIAALYAGFELRLLWHFLRGRRAIVRSRTAADEDGPPLRDGAAPSITIQIPLYNERTAAEIAIRAAALQDYPKDRFDIQVLDDSTDETSALVETLVEQLRRTGVQISHVRREGRTGYKAGALSHGLSSSTSELVAIFDADFAPAPSFLRRLVLELRSFDDADVAFVQARWGFVNSDENLLTSAQTLLIDRHFYVQKPTWAHLGRVTVFNGSGGLWRRAAIEDAGGWSADTLTEDLDLSYRVAMRGWRGLYVAHVAADSELPAHLLSFKLQQRRWAHGSAQAMRKLVRAVLGSKLASPGDELFILGGYLVHPILLLNAILWPWAVLYAAPRPMFLVGQAVLSLATSVGPISFALTAREVGRPLSLAFLRDVLFATVLGMGLMVNNTFAHLSGYWSKQSPFDRTPKKARSGETASYRLALDWTVLGELLLLGYSVWSAWVLLRAGQIMWVPPCILWAVSMAVMIAMQVLPQGAAIDRRLKTDT